MKKTYKPRLKIMFFLIFLLAIFGLAKSSWAACDSSHKTECCTGTGCSTGLGTKTAIDGSHDAVQFTIDISAVGETVNVPADTKTWNTPVSPGRISLSGAGCTLDANGVPTSNCLTNITCSETCISSMQGYANNSRISGFKFINTTYNTDIIRFEGVDWRVDHNYFDTISGNIFSQAYDGGVFPSGQYARGLVDHNFMHNARVISWGGDLFVGSNWNIPDVLWAQGPSTAEPYQNKFGDKYAVYAEDNTVQGDTFFDVTEAHSGGRIVWRFNRLTNTSETDGNGGWLAVHGKASGGSRGTQRWEMYSNILSNPAGSVYIVANYRGGTGVFFNNKVTGNWGSYTVGLDNYRNISPEYDSFGLCDGTDLRDQLVSPYA